MMDIEEPAVDKQALSFMSKVRFKREPLPTDTYSRIIRLLYLNKECCCGADRFEAKEKECFPRLELARIADRGQLKASCPELKICYSVNFGGGHSEQPSDRRRRHTPTTQRPCRIYPDPPRRAYLNSIKHRDKIFAMRDMLGRIGTELEPPDYARPVEDVLTRAAYAAIYHDGDLQVLVSITSARLGRILPSWVSDWLDSNVITGIISWNKAPASREYTSCVLEYHDKSRSILETLNTEGHLFDITGQPSILILHWMTCRPLTASQSIFVWH